MLAAAFAGSFGASSAWAGEWRIEPAIKLGATYSDNIRLARAGQQRSDFAPEVSPSIGISGKGARFSADIDYSLQQILYLRDSQGDRSVNSLRARGELEVIENFAYIDARASISQQNVSAFGAQASDNVTINDNRTEATTWSLSPYLKGGFGLRGRYELRYTAGETDGNSGTLGRTRSSDWRAHVEQFGAGYLGAALDYDSQTTDYAQSGERKIERAYASALLAFDAQWRFSANVGYEKNNFLPTDPTGMTWGYGIEWSPTPRTDVSWRWDDRLFGKSYAFRFDHRTPLSAWSFSYSQDVTTSNDQLSGPGDEALFSNVLAALTPLFPDPVARNAEALRVIQAFGGNIFGLSERVFQDRRLRASVALVGARNTLTLALTRSERTDRDALSTLAGDDLSLSQRVRTDAATVSLTHKLTPLTSLNAGIAHTDTQSITGDARTTKQLSLTAGASTRLGPKTSGALNLRHVKFDATGSGSSDYRENAVVATVSHTF